MTRDERRAFDTGLPISKDTPGALMLPITERFTPLFTDCEGNWDNRELRMHLAGDTDTAGRMFCSRCGLQLLPVTTIIAGVERR